MKVKAINITPSSFTVKCPTCKKQHIFDKVGYAKYMLNRDEMDTFEMDENGQLYPMWVCRNEHCPKMDTLLIENIATV